MATLTVQGYATRIFFEGKGVEVTEFYPGKDGEQKKRTFTAWFELAPDLELNAYGTFIGTASAKVRFWVDKEGQPVISKVTGEQGVSADVSLNNAIFTPGREPDAVSRATADPVAKLVSLGAQPIINDDLPF
jgi:hypothetical protein